MSRVDTLIDYQFKYPDGQIRRSGGSSGLCIVHPVDHSATKVGDQVMIEQFNLSGSRPGAAVIIGKRVRLWDWSKPSGMRCISDIKTGEI